MQYIYTYIYIYRERERKKETDRQTDRVIYIERETVNQVHSIENTFWGR